MENQITQPVREIEVVTAEIKEIKRQAQNMALMYAIEIGRRLVEAKSVLPHGKWGEWLKCEVNFSQATANNFMKLFEEYGSAQISIFGAVSNSQTIGNLPYSKALQLLSVPAEEREDFAKEVKADEISVRELQAAIRERNEAKKKAEEAEAAREEIEMKAALAEKAKAEAEERARKAEEAQEEYEKLKHSYAETEKKLSDTKKKLKEAKNNPKLSPEKLEAIKKELEETIKKENEKDTAAKIEKAKEDVRAAREKMAEAEKLKATAEERLAEAQRKLKTADPEITSFKTLFDEFQKLLLNLKGKLKTIKERDPDVGEKLEKAMKELAKHF